MSKESPSRLAVAGVLAYLYVPAVAVLAILGWKVGWRAPVGLVAGTAVVVAKTKLGLQRRRSGAKPIAWPLQMLVLVLLGTAIGGVLVGTPGFMMGLLMGVALGLPPVSVRNKDGVVAPLDRADPVQSATAAKTVALFLAALPVGGALLFGVGLLIERLA